ncbi:MAG: hypothetical protein R2839_09670 [Thermomicrobiales bacterium]
MTNTLSGRVVNGAIWLGMNEDELLARMARGGARRSSSPKTCSFKDKRSLTASMTRSASRTASSSDAVKRMREIAPGFLPLAASVVVTVSIAASSMAVDVSVMATAYPASANSRPIPWPMIPAPITAMFPIVVIVSSCSATAIRSASH